eukprot:TRINITY_DN174_c0_g1_i1.p1 TRINITY_DN174_c0_g1~~TRINITY_DN174_c0_g1_i1.p1  ORF type:complete len:142 (-),score=34.68 TRINITY_DN174_c0_g1_i1:156-581(-)
MATQIAPEEYARLQSWFQAVDTDRSGSVSAKELQVALAKGGLNYSLPTIRALIAMFDNDRTGNVSFQEYCSIHFFIMNMRNIFVQNDVRRTSSLSPAELQHALTAAGFTVGAPTFEVVARKFDKDKRAPSPWTSSWKFAST